MAVHFGLNLFLVGGAALMWACLLIFARRLIRNRTLAQTHITLPDHESAGDLRPAEIAYLSRDGDMTHTLIVMVIDLIQRAVKAKSLETTPSDLAPYEKEMWRRIKDQVLSWAEKKANEINPLATTNPGQILKRVNAIKTFFTRTVGRFLQDVVRDPRRLKRYFSLGGIVRVVADLTSAGYGAMVEEDLRKNLLARGFLVEEDRRTRGGTISASLAVGNVILFAGSCFLVRPYMVPEVYAAFLAAMCAGFAAGCVLRALLMVPQFVPFYEEISLVLNEVGRASWQAVVLRSIFRAARLIAWLVFAVTIIVISITAALIFAFGMHTDWVAALFGLFAFTVWWIACLQLFIDAHRLILQENKTLRAEQELAKTKKDIAHATAIGTLKDVFANPDYDPTFSNLVAVYGVETIWLLTK